MNDNKSLYLNRNFDDYKQLLKEYIKQYYPQIANDFDDASIGSWMIDMVASVADNLSFYIDKAYNETNVDSASQKSSVFNLARSNGLKIPGPKGSVALCEFSCMLDPDGANRRPDWDYAPIIKKGTKVSSRSQVFEVMSDIDFADEFDYYGRANRDYFPVYNSQGKIIKYKVVKKEVVSAGESRIYKQVFSDESEIYPFMEIVIPDDNVMEIESIIFKIGTDHQSDPNFAEFMIESEHADVGSGIYRFFEVESLSDHYMWGDSITAKTENNQFLETSKTYKYASYSSDDSAHTDTAVYSVTKGEWVPITQKFVSEFTDKGYLKITFGSGEKPTEIISGSDFAEHQISKIVRNNFLGKLPPARSTMYILYKVGGGLASNVAANTITNIVYLNSVFCNGGTDTNKLSDVRRSISVTNPSQSVGGKDAPNVDEIRAMIKYNSSAQNRCVTVKDYENRIMLMPTRYGCPFRVSVTEENNKVMVYMLGINADGTLSDTFPQQMIENIGNYLSMYRSINDFVEIKSGRIVNISVTVSVFISKNYNSADVVSDISKAIKDFFDVNKRQMGAPIFVNELTHEIMEIGGVSNVVDLEIWNKYGAGYSSVRASDPVVEEDEGTDGESRIDIASSQYTLNSDADSMFEIKNKELGADIIVKTFVR